MKKWVKIILITVGLIGVIIGALYFYAYYFFNQKYIPKENSYKERVAYINPENSIASDGFETCNEYIYDYYNPERAQYMNGKKELRKFILNNYRNLGFSDSGYLNIRFVINCEGKVGRYVTHENDLDLNPIKFNSKLKTQLLQLTRELKQWKPNIIRGDTVDSYMYISYRIENGEITEIIP